MQPFMVDDIPWRPQEIEALRKFLLDVKSRGQLTHTTKSDSYNVCILKGQTGSAKMSTIKLLCNNCGLKIIEYDPFDVSAVCRPEEHDSAISSLVSFLETATSRSGLKMTKNSLTFSSGSLACPLVLGSRKIKRLKCTSENANAESNTSNSEPHLILVSDLPRTILTSKSSSLYEIQYLLKSIVNGQSTHNEKTYPLLICVNNSAEDTMILKRILPNNYTKHPKCLNLNLKNISKTKMKSLLKLDKKFQRFDSHFNSLLLDYVANISSGDIRYAFNNLRFYLSNSKDQGSNTISQFDTLKAHMLERNIFNTFGLLGRVLYNKRLPISLSCPNENKTIPMNMNISRFKKCMDISRAIQIYETEYVDGVSCDYADILEIIPLIDSTIASMESSITYEPPTQEFVTFSSTQKKPIVSQTESKKPHTSDSNPHVDLELVNNENLVLTCEGNVGGTDSVNLYDPLNMVMWNKGYFDESFSAEIPANVRLFGLVDPFDEKNPLGYTKWPKIESKGDCTPSRHTRHDMLPKLSRPQLYYDPDSIIDDLNSEYNYFVNSMFDNYSDLFGNIDDCATFSTHLTCADMFYTRVKGASYYIGDDIGINRHFISICIRAAVDSNLSGFEGTKNEFHPFTKYTTSGSIKYKTDYIRGLYDSYRMDVHKLLTSDEYIPSHSSIHASASKAFIETLPMTFIALTHSTEPKHTQVHDVYENVQDDSRRTSIESTFEDIMTLDVLDQVDELMQGTGSKNVNTRGRNDSVNLIKLMDTVTPRFKDLLSEISKHYANFGGNSQIQITHSIKQAYERISDSS
ncbi:hypothetical protein BEWA_040600 [Theileria equi strain WA]|uniref:Uncharacterized protein n=1 Tax=Theileria equi strain WA TaxID=1537102 RepID=L1LF04_THEEQ|nr:hypothetical protein BEWA_040600 [Theileria equi strain WA]EKX74022.1 hypothetical protein BEWA_040600 [Theileria equi strain WA]|eukprot:XP_004833474.1 hypothetical protein BEWA_040600 [Theileria equi strain WA]